MHTRYQETLSRYALNVPCSPDCSVTIIAFTARQMLLQRLEGGCLPQPHSLTAGNIAFVQCLSAGRVQGPRQRQSPHVQYMYMSSVSCRAMHETDIHISTQGNMNPCGGWLLDEKLAKRGCPNPGSAKREKGFQQAW